MNMTAECPGDPVLQEDLEIAAGDPELEKALRRKRILVTGATGLVGSWLIRALACMNRLNGTKGTTERKPDGTGEGREENVENFYGNGMEIFGVIRNEEKAEQIYGKAFMERPDVHFIRGDLTDSLFVKEAETQIMPAAHLDLVIHGAAVTASRAMVEKPVETIMTAVLGTRNALELAHRCGADDFVYLSSMEMYGDLAAGSGLTVSGKKAGIGRDEAGGAAVRDKTPEKESAFCDTRATEDRLGWLDLMRVRTDYPESKRMCENLCIGYGEEYGLNVKIARLAQTFGAGILPWENRVFAQFARSVIREENIVLHTHGFSEGNYCYTRDAVRGILTIAEKGRHGEAYNVANEEAHTTIASMAEMVAERIAGGRIRVVYDIQEGNQYGYAADTRLLMDASKLRGLGWKPEIGLEEMYRRMIASMRAKEQ